MKKITEGVMIVMSKEKFIELLINGLIRSIFELIPNISKWLTQYLINNPKVLEYIILVEIGATLIIPVFIY